MEHIIFVWDGKPCNYVKVCFESLRLYNKTCKIHLFYTNEEIVNEYKKYNIDFQKIDKKFLLSPQYYQIKMLKEYSFSLKEGEKILALDCDLLFQNDPFTLFNKEKGDFYYTHSILSGPDSLRPKKIQKMAKYTVNAGVFGLIVNENSRKLMDFWLKNLDKPFYKDWINCELLKIRNNWWTVDQNFLNFLDHHDLPFPFKKVIVNYRYNYFVSTWGHFHEKLNMGNKIGNKDFVIIHFKANFKDTYNLNNPKIYNMKNILEKKDLTTEQSRKNIYKKFMSRGERRFHIV